MIELGLTPAEFREGYFEKRPAYMVALHEGVLSRPIYYFMLFYRSLMQLSIGRDSRLRELRAGLVSTGGTLGRKNFVPGSTPATAGIRRRPISSSTARGCACTRCRDRSSPRSRRPR
jgi:hypothetical protein